MLDLSSLQKATLLQTTGSTSSRERQNGGSDDLWIDWPQPLVPAGAAVPATSPASRRPQGAFLPPGAPLPRRILSARTRGSPTAPAGLHTCPLLMLPNHDPPHLRAEQLGRWKSDKSEATPCPSSVERQWHLGQVSGQRLSDRAVSLAFCPSVLTCVECTSLQAPLPY